VFQITFGSRVTKKLKGKLNTTLEQIGVLVQSGMARLVYGTA
jgi:hypothetical protein